MGEPWMMFAHDTLTGAYADRANLHYGREIVFFSLSNKAGSAKVLYINRVRIGCTSVLAFTGVVGIYAVYRVEGVVSGPIEVMPTPMDDDNAALPPEIRGFYSYNYSPLAMLPFADVGASKATEWGLIRRMPFIWDEPVNNAFAAPTFDEIAGNMQCFLDIIDYTDMKATDIQKITIREGQSLVIAVSNMPADGAIRADIQIEFEVG